MLQTIKKFFVRIGTGKKNKSKVSNKMWAEKQLKGMAKLGGKLILM